MPAHNRMLWALVGSNVRYTSATRLPAPWVAAAMHHRDHGEATRVGDEVHDVREARQGRLPNVVEGNRVLLGGARSMPARATRTARRNSKPRPVLRASYQRKASAMSARAALRR